MSHEQGGIVAKALAADDATVPSVTPQWEPDISTSPPLVAKK